MKPRHLLLPSAFLLPTVLCAVTPKDLVDHALSTNPEIRYYEAEIAAAKGGRRAAGQIANPELSVDAARGSAWDLRTGEKEGDGPVWKATIMQTFDFPGRIPLRKAIADRDVALAELGLAQFKSQLANEVRARAGDVTLLRRLESAARAVRKRFEELIGVLMQRDTGTVSAKLERRILEASLLTSDRELTDAGKEAKSAAAALNVLCGYDPDRPLNLDDDAVPAFPGTPSLDSLKTQAAHSNFDLQQKRLQMARQGLKIDLTKSERWGKISFGPYVQGYRVDEKEKEAGVVLSVPLPLWNRNKGGIAAEEARLSQAEALMFATLRDLERDLAIERSAYASELEALSRWKPESEKEFRDAAEEADRHYRLGAVPISTYVEMQRQYLEAMRALIQTRRNAWKHLMSMARLVGEWPEVKR
ncbi:MAG: TolC family protein [Verrucomicrobiaceae bacterium]|nr:TolC family protein [Verrucomicrobiaceae bacterium]